MTPRCAQASDVDAYFAGRSSPVRQGRLRAHLCECAACRSRFDRQLQLAALDPQALPFEERLGRSLGLRSHGPFGPRAPWWAASVGIVALAAVVLMVRPASRSGSEFQARGAGEPPALVFSLGAPATDVLAFRTDHSGAPGLQTGQLSGTAELAFAYRNGGGWQRLMVFARDEIGNVYWYQPPWTDGRDDPGAVTLATGPGLHELPTAVSHDFRGQRLTLCAVVTNQPLSARQVEQQLQLSPGTPPAQLLAEAGREAACRELEAVP